MISPEGLPASKEPKPTLRQNGRLPLVDLQLQDPRHARRLVPEELVAADVKAGVAGLDLLIGDQEGGGSTAPGAAPRAAKVAHAHADTRRERLGQRGRTTGGE